MGSSAISGQHHYALQAYRADIDGMRAVAIIAVVVFHAFPTKLHGGFVGVDIFFVISGYLISGIILRSVAAGGFDFLLFYARRVKRLFPALALVFASSLAFGWFALFPDELRHLGQHTAAGAAFVGNFLLWTEAGYFDSASELKPLLHLWSLGIEEQFYLIFPLTIWAIWRARIRPLPVLVVLILISFTLNVVTVAIDPAAAFFLPHTRFWELLAGALLATLDLSPGAGAGGPDARRRNELWASLGLLLVVAAAFGINRNKAFPGFWALFPVVGTWLLIWSGPATWVNRKILAVGPMVWIGKISYPLYLWHWPLFSFAKIVASDTPPPEVRSALAACSVVLAWLTYRFVERPIRVGPTSALKVGSLCFLVSVAGIAGYVAYANGGFEGRAIAERHSGEMPDFTHRIFSSYIQAHFPLCTPPEMQRRVMRSSERIHCAQSDPSAPKTVAIVGDSHAEHLFIGIAEQLRGRENVAYFFQECLPFLGLTGTEGCDNVAKILEYVAADPHISTVILASAWAGRSADKATRPRTPVPGRGDGMDSFEVGLRETLAALNSAHKRVYLALDIPEFPKGPFFCSPPRPFAPNRAEVCSIPKADYLAATERFESLVQSVLAKGDYSVKLIRPGRYLCDDARCWMRRQGVLLYRDTNHLSVEGSKYVGGQIARELFDR